MTSDAKIGLLLGLVFIFIIAFVINGLPRFRNALDNDEIKTTQDFVQDEPIGATVRNTPGVLEKPMPELFDNYPAPDENKGTESVGGYKTPWSDDTSVAQDEHADQSYYPQTYYAQDSTSEQTSDYTPAVYENENGQDTLVSSDAQDQDNVRDIRLFPFNISNTSEVPINQPSDQQRGQFNRGAPGFGWNAGGFRQGGSAQGGGPGQWNRRGQQAQTQPPAQQAQQDKTVQQSQTNQAALPKTYVVQEGDNNLSKIAKKFYGEEEGNRLVNVNKIFEANKNVLKSPDKVFVGQTIVIPQPELPAQNTKPSNVLKGTMFQTVPSIGGIRQDTNNKQNTGRWYEVKEDDNLWKIAAEQLGKGSRFNEISQLNADILTNENKLKPGMKLLLPDK
jgi:hypothetical protein